MKLEGATLDIFTLFRPGVQSASMDGMGLVWDGMGWDWGRGSMMNRSDTLNLHFTCYNILTVD